jgi:hypothetical protein
MDYLSILPNEIRYEIYSYLTPQEILHSCCLNKAFVKFITEKFWYQHVIRTYNPRDFGIAKFDTNSLAHLNVPSWTELAKLSFASRTIPGVVTASYHFKRDTINMMFELNFFSCWKDMENDLVKYFNSSSIQCLSILIKGHIDENTEAGIAAIGHIKNISSKFGPLEWKIHTNGFRSQVVSHDMSFGDDIHIGMFNIININFFSKIEKI